MMGDYFVGLAKIYRRRRLRLVHHTSSESALGDPTTTG
jgi:hypothetical protein